MPVLTEEEINARIKDGSIFAITVDTNIFDKYGCNLDFRALRALDQFNAKPTRVLFSEVVTNEIKNHIARDAGETQRELKRALRQHSLRWKTDYQLKDVQPEFALDAAPKIAAAKQVDEYVATVDGEILSVNVSGDVSPDVFRRYFAFEPPFEEKDEKRHEFPDAFALLSLEAFAAQAGKLILCVSSDKGWKAYSDASEHLVCVHDLSAALSYFNPPGLDAVERVLALWRAGNAPLFGAEIETAFDHYLDGLYFTADAQTGYMYESEPLRAVLRFVNGDIISNPVIIEADNEEVVFSIRLEALVGFEANFEIYIRDSIDRDFMVLDNVERYVEQHFDYELIITIPREFEGEPDLIEVEIAKRDLDVYFGTVEPFEGENPEYDKY